MNDIELVIFDCDGVLVDSELIASEVVAGYMIPFLNQIIGREEFISQYGGMPDQEIAKYFATKYSVSFPINLHQDIVKEVDKALELKLTQIDGAEACVSKIGLSKAVASNSPYNRLRCSLSNCGLDKYFKSNIYSSDLVGIPKPSPEIYLYVANKFGLRPEKCLAIEDSQSGVIAANKAGMLVIGFLGGSHAKKENSHKLILAGASHIFYSMHELSEFMANKFY